MTKKFRNKYRITSARLQHWDYGSNAAYFITICTQDRVCFFGEVQNDEMKWNDCGQIANNIWIQIPQQFPYVNLANFVVMPNHVHGILVIDKNDMDGDDGGGMDVNHVTPTTISSVTTISSGGITGDKNPMIHDNVSRVIRWYKGRCTYEIRKSNPTFGWQPRFYDHIIRNDSSFHRISKYILNNPKKWDEDKFYN